jgi:hypothetical protein
VNLQVCIKNWKRNALFNRTLYCRFNFQFDPIW